VKKAGPCPAGVWKPWYEYRSGHSYEDPNRTKMTRKCWFFYWDPREKEEKVDPHAVGWPLPGV
jgi:hypothetical protein